MTSVQVDLLKNETSDIGGKAKGLLLLKSMGYKVPGFFIISCVTVADWKRRSRTKETLIHVIYQDIQNWDESLFVNVAVRSSALGEDSQMHSFAGIHTSRLNVTGIPDAVLAIADVIESAQSPLALSYRVKNRLPTDNIQIAVVIQKMVAAQISGVAFGVDLQSGCRHTAWISVAEGLADKLVSGEVAGEDYLYKNGTVTSLASTLTSTLNTQGHSPLSLSDEQSEARKAVAKHVGESVLAISESQRKVMDIEWAYDGQDCWFVQARPVTAVPTERNRRETVFDNSNIQESYCGVTTPLTFSYASIAYTRVYEQLMNYMMISKKDIQLFRPQLGNMIGLVKGRVFYNINSWYSGLLFMPSFGKRKQEMEDMMGLEEPVDFILGQSFSSMQKISKLPKMIQLLVVMVYRFARMNQLVRGFDSWFTALYESAQIQTVYRQTEHELVQNIKKFQDLFLEKWGIPVLNDTKVMLDMGRVKRRLQKYGSEVELKTLLYGSEIESIKPTLEIHRLSKVFAGDPQAEKILKSKSGSELLESLLIFKPDLYHQVQEFIHSYGDRCMGELKLETVTMRQDPEILFLMIRSYIQGGLHLKQNLFQSHDLKQQDKVFSQVTSNMTFAEKIFFNRGVKKLKKSISDRELMRLHRTRNFGLMREYFLALGQLWQQRSFLTSARDIFFLTQDEIFQIADGRFYGVEVMSTIELRKRQFEEHKKSSVKTQMKTQFPNSLSVVESTNEATASQSQYKGLSCSQGCVEGDVVVVNSPQDAVDLQGKILVAERTDPGWTPLFALIKGVIIEKGSMLSHSAVIAREMGIPAVLGIKDITKNLKTGDRVKLDGTNGSISIIYAARGNETVFNTRGL